MSNVFYRTPGQSHPVADRAEGVWIWDRDGNRYLDGSGGACVVSIGHGVREVEAAVRDQMDRLSFVHGSQFTSEACEELARRVVGLSDDPALSRVYFVSTGSEAVETAVKLARQYWREVGQPDRYKIISRWASYHGNTAGALALGGHTGRRRHYLPLLLHTPHIEPCYCYRCPFGAEPASCTLPCADALERTICYEGPDSVAAFIGEPVVGATAGVLVPPAGYWPRIREICDRYGILLIADEVMTGVGRTGRTLCLEHWGVAADLVTLAKQLSSGYAPLGAVLCRDTIHDAIGRGSGSFVHGFTYNQHPVAMAVGNAVLQYVEEHRLVERSARLGPSLLARLDELRRYPAVGDVRGLGLFAAVELVADRASKRTFDPQQKVAARVTEEARARGLIVYPGSGGADGIRGDHIVVCPPFIIEEEQLDLLGSVLGESIEAATRAGH
jgi:adenosylmethionine-8-amino-7-oxononanoate aminotransferase